MADCGCFSTTLVTNSLRQAARQLGEARTEIKGQLPNSRLVGLRAMVATSARIIVRNRGAGM
jgi:hypothetical protein